MTDLALTRRFDVIQTDDVWQVQEIILTESYRITHPERYMSELLARLAVDSLNDETENG